MNLQHTLTLTILIAVALVTGCGDDSADGKISVAVSSETPGAEIPALWAPAAVLQLPDGSFLVAERATRDIRKVSPDGSTELVMSIRGGEDVADFRTSNFGPGFGRTIVELERRSGLVSQVLVASEGEPLLLLDLVSRRTVRIGGRRAPEPGQSIEETDMSGLRGLARFQDQLYLALDDQIWRAELTTRNEPGVRTATLALVAGNGRRGVGPAVGVASQVPLELSRWVGMATGPDGEILYFTDGPRLRAVIPGRIVTVTGDGNRVGSVPLSLQEFSSSWEGFSLGHRGERGPFFVNDNGIKEIVVQSIDFETGDVEGTVESALPGGVPELNGFDVKENGRLVVTTARTGALAQVTGNGEDFESILGPLSTAERWDLSDPESPFRLQELVQPQAVAALAAGEVAFANSPLAKLLLSVDRTVEPPAVDSVLAQPMQVLGFDLIASDNDRQLYVKNGGFMLRIRVDAATGEPTIEQIPRFFTAPLPLGIPGPGADVGFTSRFELDASADFAVLWLPGDSGATAVVDLQTGWVDWENQRRFGRIPLVDDAYLPGTDLSGLSAHAVSSDPETRFIALPDPEGSGHLVARGDLDTNQYVVIAGGGELPPEVSSSPLEAELPEVVGLAIVDQSLFVALNGNTGTSLFRLSEELEPVETCGDLPENTDSIAIMGSAAAPLLVTGNPGVSGLNPVELHACASTPAALGDTVLTPGVWAELGAATAPPTVHRPSMSLIYSAVRRGLPVVVRSTMADVLANAVTTVVDLPFGLEREVFAAAATLDALLLGIDTEDGSPIVYRMALPPLEGTPVSGPLTLLAGGGSMVPRGVSFTDVAFGVDPAAMAVGGDGDLYLAMRDTEVLWQLDAGANGVLDTEPDDLVWPIATGKPIFSDDGPITLAVDGDRVWVGSSNAIYRAEEGMAVLRYGKGATAPRDGLRASDAALTEIRGLAVADEKLVVLTDRALFTVDDTGIIHMLSRDGELVLDDGSRRPLGFTVTTHPVLSPGRPGEVLMAYPGTQELLSVDL